MSYITDFKSAPFDVFPQPATSTNYSGTATPVTPGYTGTGLNGIPDYGLDSLCGSKWATEDGRILTLVSNAAVALTSGKLVQTRAENTAFEKLAMTVPTAYPATAGQFQVLVTNGGSVVGQNVFAGGYLVVASGTGIGQTLKINSNAAAAASATFVVTLEDPIQVTLDATSTVSLLYSPFKNVIVAPASETGVPVGATIYPVPASVAATFDATSGLPVLLGTPQYFYVVSHGPSGILVDATITNVGYPVGRSATVAGAVGVATLTTVGQIGLSMQTLTSAQTGLIYLSL